MNKNIYIALAVIAVLAIGGWLLYGAGSGSPTLEGDDTSNNQEELQENEDGTIDQLDEQEDSTQEDDTQNEESVTENGTDDDPNQEETKEQKMQYSVGYTSSGFTPATVTVPEGATVVFVNNSSSKMWVASDPHPVHTDYSAFDSRRGVSSGETYEFTFDHIGEYNYHNHLSPAHGGVVIVE